MGTRFNRVGVRAAGTGEFGPNGFVPETLANFWPGADEMSFVSVFRLNELTVPEFIDSFASFADSTPVSTGFDFEVLNIAPDLYVWASFGDGVGFSGDVAQSRNFTARDQGKVHRAVAVASVAGDFVRCWLNGQLGPVESTHAAYAPPDLATFNGTRGIIGTDNGFGLVNSDLLCLAAVDQALTPEQIAELDRQILATGTIPPGFAPWVWYFDPARLVGHSQVWDQGGLNAGRAVLNESNGGPTLTSISFTPEDWGGSGV